MFETLDEATLAEMTKIDDLSSLKAETRLSEMLACLQQAARECNTVTMASGFSANGAEQVAVGIYAAQRILEKVWSNKMGDQTR